MYCCSLWRLCSGRCIWSFRPRCQYAIAFPSRLCRSCPPPRMFGAELRCGPGNADHRVEAHRWCPCRRLQPPGTSAQTPNVECIARFAHNLATKELLKVTIVQNGRKIHVDRFVGLVPGCFLHDHIVARPAGETPPGRLSQEPGILPEPLHIDSRTTALLRRRETAAPAGAVPVPASSPDFGRDALGFYDFSLVTASGGYLNGVPQPAPPMSSDVRAAPAHLACCRVPGVVMTELATHERDALRERLVAVLAQTTTSPICASGAAPLASNVCAPRLNIVEPTNDCLHVLDPSPSLTTSSPVTWISASSTPGPFHHGRPPSHVSTPGSAMRSMSPIGHSPIRDTPGPRHPRPNLSAARPGTLAVRESAGRISTLDDTQVMENEPQGNLGFHQIDNLPSSSVYGAPLNPRIGQATMQSQDTLAAQLVNQQRGEHRQQQLQLIACSTGPQLRLQSSPIHQTFSGRTHPALNQALTPTLQEGSVAPAHFPQGQRAQTRFSQAPRRQLSYAYTKGLAENELERSLLAEPPSHQKQSAQLRTGTFSSKSTQAEAQSLQVQPDLLELGHPSEQRSGDVIFSDPTRLGGSSGQGASGIYRPISIPSGNENGEGRPSTLGDVATRLESVGAQDVMEEPAAIVASSSAMAWLGVGSGAPEPFRVLGTDMHASFVGPDVSDVFSSLPLAAAQSSTLVDVPGSGPRQVVSGTNYRAIGSIVATTAVSDDVNTVAGAPAGQTAVSGAPLALLHSDQKPKVAGRQQSQAHSSASRDDGMAAAGSSGTSTARIRGRGGRGWLAATPSDIVMRNRISAQKSNEKRRRRILASKHELALLRSVTLPRLQIAQLVLRAENERVRQALANKYGRHWVTVESFF
jgi:hypothetical protein